MFAVREEVEVLKEKIAELMDRINQLELENSILKAHASQETLAQLSATSTTSQQQAQAQAQAQQTQQSQQAQQAQQTSAATPQPQHSNGSG